MVTVIHHISLCIHIYSNIVDVCWLYLILYLSITLSGLTCMNLKSNKKKFRILNTHTWLANITITFHASRVFRFLVVVMPPTMALLSVARNIITHIKCTSSMIWKYNISLREKFVKVNWKKMGIVKYINIRKWFLSYLC